ncbi:TetR/AcrR family transcriptional regulator [Variovorax sp. J22R24]|uniref:TetR/AcrR family transcriptional regulator n=1 Tax=Variovorax gracilis TaxID=3053502 RepID=UPI002576743F|nr:TetR/AcrR family transcriptional regulator [Variovorax sp. J22R24]MDM0104125.1 TetR/AcrR family transcriptional regulator [Variovorax sp. J22R24]
MRMQTGPAGADPQIGRPNQRRRTRKDLLQAASRLLKQGLKPSLEDIAEEAAVSRATAYRYFPNVDALHREASLDMAVPEPQDVLNDVQTTDPVARLERVDGALHDMIAANEAPLRMMLAHSIERVVRGDHDSELPARQNRRTPLIEAALAPARSQFEPAALKNLSHALALVIGTEAMVVFKDVLQLDDAEALKVRRWAIRALVDAARKPD